MNNFDIIILNEEKENSALVVMKTSEPPFDFLTEMEDSLRKLEYVGIVVIDELLHSGNSEERFIQGFFNGNNFEKGKFEFLAVAKKSKLRVYMCDFLRKDDEFLKFSCLTVKQQKLVQCGCII